MNRIESILTVPARNVSGARHNTPTHDPYKTSGELLTVEDREEAELRLLANQILQHSPLLAGLLARTGERKRMQRETTR